jgi:fermentation-respiration switch protein FrsA (DUF1100 family)
MRTDSRRTHNPFNALMVLVIAGVVFFAIYARQTAHEFLFRPPVVSYERDSSFEYVVAEDGVELNVFWEAAGRDAWTVLYLCGSEEDLSMAMPKLRNYQLKGYNVASFEYRGYGFTDGTPNESNLYEDAGLVYDYLLREKGVNESRLVLHGRSVGGGVATELATIRDPARLILESTFTSVYENLLSLKWIPGDMFENENKASKVDCPVLLIHGEADSIVDVANSIALQGSFGGSKVSFLSVPEAGHRNVERVGGLAYWTAIEQFVRAPKSGQ